MKVPFVDLHAMHEEVRPEIEAAFHDVFDRSSFVARACVDQFEQDFAAYLGARQAVVCASGTEAVKLALMAAGVRAGEAVLVPSLTCIATAEAVRSMGAHPIFLDCELNTYHLSPAAMEDYLLEHCRPRADGRWIDGKSGSPITAVLPVHLYGMVADMTRILDLAHRHNLVVVEDAAQAHAATYVLDGKRMCAGTMGAAGAFSFYPGKPLAAVGGGGAVVLADEASAGRTRLWRDQAPSARHAHLPMHGWDVRADAMQCALLDIKLKKLDEWNSRRRQVAAWYQQRLGGNEKIVLPIVPEERAHIYHLYVVRVSDRERVMKELAAQGIETGLQYPIPLHLDATYRDLGWRRGDLPVTELVTDSILSLPMFPHMTETMVEFVCASLQEVLEALPAPGLPQ